MNQQLNMFDQQAGKVLRDQGMKRAIDNAEKQEPNWKEQALEYVKEYPDKEFQTEQVRMWAHSMGLPKPPNPRAWGAVMTTAKKQGLVKFVGYRNVQNPRAHSTPAAVWRKV